MKQKPAGKYQKALVRYIKRKTLKLHPQKKGIQNQTSQPFDSMEQTRLILQNMPVMLAAFDENVQIIFWNHELERVTGYPAGDVLNNPEWLRVFFPDEAYRSYITNTLAVEMDKFRNWECDIVCKDGTIKTISWSSVRDIYPIPEWKHWGIAFDISQRNATENALREALIWTGSILETALNGYFTYKMDGSIDVCNQSFCQQTGYDREEITSMNIAELETVQHDEFENQNNAIIESGHRLFEVAIRRKDGSTILLEINASFLFTDDGGRFVCFARDITLQRHIEKALRQSEERYRLIADNIYDVILTLDVDGNFTYISPSIERLSGFTVGEVMLQGKQLLFSPESLRVFRNILREMRESEKTDFKAGAPPAQLEFLLNHKDGSQKWVEMLTSIIFDNEGSCYGVLGVLHDIHDRKITEISEQQQRHLAEALAASAAAMNSKLDKYEVLKQILINIRDVVPHDSANFSLIDAKSGIIHVIRLTVKPSAAYEISEKELEYKLDDVPNLRKMYDSGEPLICADTLHDPDWVKTKNVHMTRSYAGVPVLIKGENAGFLNLESYQPNFFNEEHARRLKIFADQAATAIENAQLFESALSRLIEREQIAQAEHEQRILAEALRASSTVLNSTLDLDEVLRHILVEAGRVVPHDTADVILLDEGQRIVRVTAGKGYLSENKELNSSLVDQPVNKYANLHKVLQTRKPLIIKDIHLDKDTEPNQTVPWVRSQITVPIFSKGEIAGFIKLGSAEAGFFNEKLADNLVIFAVHAATAIQNAALYASVQQELEMRKKMQEKMLALQKLAALGTLAAGIAHEINSPLQTITGLSDSILARLEKNQLDLQDLPGSMQMISRNSWRVARIVQSVLTYAGASEGIFKQVDLNLLVQNALMLVEHQLKDGKNIELQHELTQGMPLFYCDAEQITYILVNLLTNAGDSILDRGNITVSTSYDDRSRRFMLQVRDNGTGIAPELQDRIFDPFFTTKPVGQGTGLGLAVTYSIVQAHGGDIQFESAPGCGTVFTITFPSSRYISADSNREVLGRYDQPV